LTLQRDGKKKQKEGLRPRDGRITFLIILSATQLVLLVVLLAGLFFSTSGNKKPLNAVVQPSESAGSPETPVAVPDTTQEAGSPVPQVSDSLQEELPRAVQNAAGADSPAVSEPLALPVRVEILNGTKVGSLAYRMGQKLLSSEVDVLETANADRHDYRRTVVICRSPDRRAGELVAQRLNFPAGRIEWRPREDAPVDVTIILGKDYKNYFH